MSNFFLSEDAQLLEHVNVLFNLDEHQRLVRVNESDPEDEPPFVFLVRGFSQNLVFFRNDVPAQIASEITDLIARLPLWDGRPTDLATFEAIRDILVANAAEANLSSGPAFVFGEGESLIGQDETVLIGGDNVHLLATNFPYTASVLDERSPVVAVVRDGQAVSACYSSRSRRDAAEAGVNTLETFRGQGLAAQVVARWAAEVTGRGARPLYSTTWNNAASVSLAQKLGLKPYCETVSFAGESN